jgi:hypothetical protein
MSEGGAGSIRGETYCDGLGLLEEFVSDLSHMDDRLEDWELCRE